jgi:hypothetical protein
VSADTRQAYSTRVIKFDDVGLDHYNEVLVKIDEARSTFPWVDKGVENFMQIGVLAVGAGYTLSVNTHPFGDSVTWQGSSWLKIGTYKTVGECFVAAIAAWQPVYLKAIETALKRTSQVEDVRIYDQEISAGVVQAIFEGRKP